MVLRIIFIDSKNKILKIGFRSRGFPKIQKIYFSKMSILKMLKLRQFSIFLDGKYPGWIRVKGWEVRLTKSDEK